MLMETISFFLGGFNFGGQAQSQPPAFGAGAAPSTPMFNLGSTPSATRRRDLRSRRHR